MPRIQGSLPENVILEAASALFASQGVEKTSLQDVAQKVGVSKAAILHHFHSKDGLREAVFTSVSELLRSATDPVLAMPPGPKRDHMALTAIVDCALTHPGSVSLMLNTEYPSANSLNGMSYLMADVEKRVFAAFNSGLVDMERRIRVSSALASAAFLSLRATQQGTADTWRPIIIEASFSSLGHMRSAPTNDQAHFTTPLEIS